MREEDVKRAMKQMPHEEYHNVRKAGSGVKGQSLGGAHTGRPTSRPEEEPRQGRADREDRS